MDIINAYEETGSLRATAALCGTTHKTVKRVLDRRSAGQRPGRWRAPAPGLADSFTDLIFAKVKATDGRITAKRLLPVVRAAGYTGSARTLRRAVAVQWSRTGARCQRFGWSVSPARSPNRTCELAPHPALRESVRWVTTLRPGLVSTAWGSSFLGSGIG